MANYHKAKYKEGEIFFYPNLGAISAFEESAGKPIAEVFKEGKTPEFADLFLLLHESHKVASFRKNQETVSLQELKSWLDGKELLKVFASIINDLGSELGVDVEKKTT